MRPRRRSFALTVAAVLVLAAGAVAGCGAGGGAGTAGGPAGGVRVADPGGGLPVTTVRVPAGGGPAAGERTVRATPAATVLEATLALAPRDPAGQARLLAEQRDPSSPRYREYLSPAEFGRRFGPTDAALRRVRAALRAAGIEVVTAFPQRTALRVRGRSDAFARLLGTPLLDVEIGELRARRPLREPAIPAALRPTVTAISGLDTRPRLRPAAIPADGLGPKDGRLAYEVEPLTQDRLRGEGQTIAVVSFDSFDPADLRAFERRFGIDGPAVEQIPVNGGTEPGEGQDEVNLDLDVIRGVAPRAKILDYEAPNTGTGFADHINQIVAEGRARIVSISWGICEGDLDAAGARGDEQAFAAAAAQGISIFVATGDAGAYECQRGNPPDTRVVSSYPATSPNVIAVGGTRLSVNRDGSWLEETGWEDTLSQGGGGGGRSIIFQRPGYQSRVADPELENGRQIPDVAASADPDSGWTVHTRGQFTVVGGTSAATPFWAATMLLTQQLAQRERAGGLGFLTPLLYDIGQGSRPERFFRDIVRGGNRKFDAKPGWDAATGFGTPRVAPLAREIVRRLRAAR